MFSRRATPRTRSRWRHWCRRCSATRTRRPSALKATHRALRCATSSWRWWRLWRTARREIDRACFRCAKRSRQFRVFSSLFMNILLFRSNSYYVIRFFRWLVESALHCYVTQITVVNSLHACLKYKLVICGQWWEKFAYWILIIEKVKVWDAINPNNVNSDIIYMDFKGVGVRIGLAVRHILRAYVAVVR